MSASLKQQNKPFNARFNELTLDLKSYNINNIRAYAINCSINMEGNLTYIYFKYTLISFNQHSQVVHHPL
jgi:hypothetical protein